MNGWCYRCDGMPSHEKVVGKKTSGVISRSGDPLQLMALALYGDTGITGEVMPRGGRARVTPVIFAARCEPGPDRL